ncbi:tryptophan-rich sensory protein [Rothia sp. AR01]|uniref:Tryptophan-rich sensory protein n=1 Tax=Rothia santali TaxID=2949643 RepID=A0A9X2HEF7_9MICC|nr:tryptophan-rich sensory protein [Rothia santali]MCP3426207.1 tryptophan-rich sensory protein [Rothia santali]
MAQNATDTRRAAPAESTNEAIAETRKAMVTGATGYVGSQVTAELLKRGWAVRTLSRSRDKALGMAWGDKIVQEGREAGPGQVEVFEGDATSADDVEAALEGVDVTWYLMHSMSGGSDFVEEEAAMARTFGAAAKRQGVGRIVYLGGLHPQDEELSEHLRSRVKVGEELMDSGVPTAALQAGVVIGEGSSSFHMLRHLSERLPGAIGPFWIVNRITPIGVRDAIHYLVGAADLPGSVNRTFDVGGPEAIPYADMMKRYAKALGLIPRVVLTAPVTTNSLASHWISLVTPVKRSLAKPLIGSLLHDTVVHERDIESYVGKPGGGNQTFEQAVRAAVENVDTRRWTRVFAVTAGSVLACAAVGSLLTDPKNRWYRSLRLPAWQPPTAVFPVVWSALYADVAAISSLMIADELEAGNVRKARSHMVALGTNLVLNAGWCGMFFRSRRPVLSTVWAGALAVSSADLVRRAAESAPQRGALLAPYAVWNGFATVLNGTIAGMNRKGRLRRAVGRLR